MRIKTVLELIKVLKEKEYNCSLYIWGSGAYGKLIGKKLNDSNINWIGYYDNFFSDENIGLNGKKIYSGENISIDSSVYIISMRDFESVYNQLKESGLKDESIIIFDNCFFKEIEKENGYTEDCMKKILSLKDKYDGESCFVVGNGPSLRKEDLNYIQQSKIKSFGCNEIYRSFDTVFWRPSFYFISDVNGIREDLQDEMFEKNVIYSKSKVFLRSAQDLIKQFHNYNNVYFFNQIYSDSCDCIQFSGKCHENVFVGFTVTYIMLQMAVYMGFKKIYLIGMDHSYGRQTVNGKLEIKNINSHTELIGDSEGGCYNVDKVSMAYESARQYAEDNNVIILNATRGGKLEVFERISIEKVLNKG